MLHYRKASAVETTLGSQEMGLSFRFRVSVFSCRSGSGAEPGALDSGFEVLRSHSILLRLCYGHAATGPVVS